MPMNHQRGKLIGASVVPFEMMGREAGVPELFAARSSHEGWIAQFHAMLHDRCGGSARTCFGSCSLQTPTCGEYGHATWLGQCAEAVRVVAPRVSCFLL